MTAVTATPKSIRPHVQVVELQGAETGYRFWSDPMQGVLAVNQFVNEQKAIGYGLSDVDCSTKCWCLTEGR